MEFSKEEKEFLNERYSAITNSIKGWFVKENYQLYKKILEETNFLDNLNTQISLRERVYCVLHDLNKEDITCTCGSGKKKSWRNGARGIWYSNGCEPNCPTIKETAHKKYKETCLEKYGVENGFQDEGIKANRKKEQSTLMKKNKKEIFAKRVIIWLEKYGVDNPYYTVSAILQEFMEDD